MNIEELLPIGSIVLLEGADKKLMIAGIKQTNLDDGTEYDYLGFLYPEGNIGEEFQFLFNHSDIDEILFRGYEDDERDQFIANMKAFYEFQDT